MKEYLYQVEHSWKKERQPMTMARRICDDRSIDADASSFLETTSESGVSDLEMNINENRCRCCPYGYHLDTDFLNFLDQMYGSEVVQSIQSMEQKRSDLRRRLRVEQSQRAPVVATSLNNEILRDTILELDRIVERDIHDLQTQYHHEQRSRSVDSRRRHSRPPPPPPLPPRSSTSSSSRTAEERRLYEHRTHLEKTITTRTHSAPRLNLSVNENVKALKKLDTNQGGPITMLYKIPPPAPFSRSSSSSSLSTETTLRVSSPEPDESQPLKPLYITEIVVPARPAAPPPPTLKTTVVTITDKSEIERRNREIERLENERRTLLTEKEILLKEIDRYKHQPTSKATVINIRTENHEEKIHHSNNKSTREVAMQHIVIEEDDKPPPLPPKQRQQRDVAINHHTEYEGDDEEKQTEIVRRKLEEIKQVYTERIHFLEERILQQEKDLEILNQPKQLRHVNTQCQPTMQDRALVTDSFRSVRDVALTCHLQPTLPHPVSHRHVNLQCNTDEFIIKRDVCMEAVPELPIQRDVSIGVALDVEPDRHYRDVGTHVNFDYKPEIHQRDVATMFSPEPVETTERASNTRSVSTREFGVFVNTIEPPKPPPKPSTRPMATDTFNLIAYKDTACGRNDQIQTEEISTDTETLFSYHDRACGLDLPRELLNRHVSTDTRTLTSTRDNFSSMSPSNALLFHDVHTQSNPIVQCDVSSNTAILGEPRDNSVQTIEEQTPLKHNSTSTELEIFHQMGRLRHCLSNTDVRRTTDRSTLTERQQSRELAINTEPKIMYSKDVGDFDVRYQHRVVNNPTRTFECALQTDLVDVKRELGYVDDHQTIEEQTTEEVYQTTVKTETEQKYRQIPIERSVKQHFPSPEELTEESYEVVSTLAKPNEGNFLVTGMTPQTTRIQRSAQMSTTTIDKSSVEHWTVTDHPQAHDQTTVKTIIERDASQRYDFDADSSAAQQRFGPKKTTDHLSSTSILKTSNSDETSSGIRSYSSSTTINRPTEMDTEENYQVTISSYDESGLKLLSPDTQDEFRLNQDIYDSCVTLNDSLYNSNITSSKVNRCLQLIQQEWFHICATKNVNTRLLENFLSYIQDNFSNFLLESIINFQDSLGNTAMHYFVTNNHWDLVKLLLDTNVCDVCIQNQTGYTAVMKAAMIEITSEDQVEIVRRLVRESGNVNVQSKDTQQTALMLAVKHGKVDLVELLLGNGASVNLQDIEGSTALMCAVEQGSVHLVKLLLSRPECDVNIADKTSQTALTIANRKNRKNILVELLSKMEEQKNLHLSVDPGRDDIFYV